MSGIPISEFKRIIDAAAENHPDAKVDFVYPKMRSGKKFGALGFMSSYKVVLGSLGGILRINIEHPPEMDEAAGQS